jgi:hypothetical protein
MDDGSYRPINQEGQKILAALPRSAMKAAPAEVTQGCAVA